MQIRFLRSMPLLVLENWPFCKQDKVEGGFLVGYHHQGICCENFTAYCADSFSKNNPGFEGVFSFAMECEIKYCCLTYLTFGNQYLFITTSMYHFYSRGEIILNENPNKMNHVKCKISPPSLIFFRQYCLWTLRCHMFKNKKRWWSCFDICAIACFYSNESENNAFG